MAKDGITEPGPIQQWREATDAAEAADAAEMEALNASEPVPGED